MNREDDPLEGLGAPQPRSEADRSSSAQSRAADASERQYRPQADHWSPSRMLDTPPSDGEFSYRWVREFVNGHHDSRNVQMRIREGYQRVPISDLPEEFQVGIDEDTRGDGYARQTGLILMRMPHAFRAQRRDYYKQRVEQAVLGADTLQGVAKGDAVREDRGSRSIQGADARRVIEQMSRT